MKEVTVWDLQTRIFHWSLVVFMFKYLVTADILRFFGIDLINKDTWLSFHIGTGMAVAMLLAFRIFWGFFGPHYSRFHALCLSVKELRGYFDSVLKGRRTSHTGHNPAASWNTVCVIVLGLLAVLSGVVVFSLDEGRGLLRFLYFDFHPFAGSLKLLHLGFAYALLGLIAAHIAGVLNESLRHKTGIITAMVTGKKRSAEPDAAITTAASLKLVSFTWVITPLFAVLYFTNSMETKQPLRQAVPPIYKKECAACHMAFPANALPAKSWTNLMANLQDHFGNDASIDASSKLEIEGYLVNNAAEHSSEEASIKFLRSIDKDHPPQGITDIPYWKEKHKLLNAAIYQRETIKSRVNCLACHKWSELGSFEDSDIRIPSK